MWQQWDCSILVFNWRPSYSYMDVWTDSCGHNIQSCYYSTCILGRHISYMCSHVKFQSFYASYYFSDFLLQIFPCLPLYCFKGKLFSCGWRQTLHAHRCPCLHDHSVDVESISLFKRTINKYTFMYSSLLTCDWEKNTHGAKWYLAPRPYCSSRDFKTCKLGGWRWGLVLFVQHIPQMGNEEGI